MLSHVKFVSVKMYKFECWFAKMLNIDEIYFTYILGNKDDIFPWWQIQIIIKILTISILKCVHSIADLLRSFV